MTKDLTPFKCIVDGEDIALAGLKEMITVAKASAAGNAAVYDCLRWSMRKIIRSVIGNGKGLDRLMWYRGMTCEVYGSYVWECLNPMRNPKPTQQLWMTILLAEPPSEHQNMKDKVIRIMYRLGCRAHGGEAVELYPGGPTVDTCCYCSATMRRVAVKIIQG
jgi:hypothetical protein